MASIFYKLYFGNLTAILKRLICDSTAILLRSNRAELFSSSWQTLHQISRSLFWSRISVTDKRRWTLDNFRNKDLTVLIDDACAKCYISTA